jgi:hypothetical protein
MAAARRRGAVAGAAIALAAAALAGRGSTPANAIGPLGGSEAPGNICLQDVKTSVLTDGWPFVKNKSQMPAVIDKVDLANPHGMKLISAWAVPILGHDAYGAEPGFPPGKTLPPGIEWPQRHAAAGAVVPAHQTGYKETDLLFVVALLAKSSSATGVDIWYHVGSKRYHIRTVFGLKVLASAAGSCPSG